MPRLTMAETRPNDDSRQASKKTTFVEVGQNEFAFHGCNSTDNYRPSSTITSLLYAIHYLYMFDVKRIKTNRFRN